MTVYYDRKCFLFLEPMLTFASFFGIFPKYDFKSKKIVSSIARTIFVCVSISLISAMVVYSLVKRADLLYPLFNSKIMIFLDIFGDLLTTFWFVLACLDTHVNAKIWEHFFQQIEDIEAYRIMASGTTTVNRFWKKPFVQFCILNIISLSGCAGILYVWYRTGPMFNPKYFWIQLLLCHIEAIAAIVTFNFILMISHKYELLNQSLNSNKQIKENFLGQIRKTKMLYCLLDETLENFNKLFGKHFLAISLMVACHLLVCLVRLVHSILGTLYSLKFGADFVSKNVFSFSMALYEAIAITFACNIAIKESQKLLLASYKVQEKFYIYSDEYQALDNLINLVINRRVRFTAAEFFDVSKSTLFTLLSGAISYLIVVLQSQRSF